MVRLTVTLCVALACLRVFAGPLGIAPREWPASNWNFTWIGPAHYGEEREQIKRSLGQLPGGQLAIVRYYPKHNPFDEWVYNDADIDDSKVVWARDAHSTDNLELIRYYRERKVWLVEPDVSPVRVSPYPLTEPDGSVH